uniref:Secreted protein n=1 Tax=Mesocestoides corti TaxID=53468 RepID=A0A5K3FWF0_MESCO
MFKWLSLPAQRVRECVTATCTGSQESPTRSSIRYHRLHKVLNQCTCLLNPWPTLIRLASPLFTRPVRRWLRTALAPTFHLSRPAVTMANLLRPCMASPKVRCTPTFLNRSTPTRRTTMLLRWSPHIGHKPSSTPILVPIRNSLRRKLIVASLERLRRTHLRLSRRHLLRRTSTKVQQATLWLAE